MSGGSIAEAVKVAGRVYEAFMSEVVEGPVLNDRMGQIGEQQRRRTEAGKAIDHRWVRLMTISGKGGWHPDPDTRQRYAAATNMTALDHFLSVVRGALMFAAWESAADSPDLDLNALEARLRAVAAIAFVHDLNKDLGLARGQQLDLVAVQQRWRYYQLDRFIAPAYSVSPDQVRFLIETVEATQAHRSPPASPPLRELTALTGYISLADKLDGLWLGEGVDAVLERLTKDQTLRSELLRRWRVLDLFDPHHPFLLDEFQRMLSLCCVRLTKVPPLFETHQDGRLVVLVPDGQGQAIIDCALDHLIGQLERRAYGLRVNVSNRGVPELLNQRPDWQRLSAYCERLGGRELGQLFRLKRSLRDELTAELDVLLGPLGLAPQWPDSPGQTLTPYPNPDLLDESARAQLRRAALGVILINHKAGKGMPDYASREQQLLQAVGVERPEWLQAVSDDASRRTLSLLWVTALARDCADIAAAVWGDQGLLRQWLEGQGEVPGLCQVVADGGGQVLNAVREHFRLRLAGERVPEPSQPGSGRCLFTDATVGKQWLLKQADGLYEVKVSAFSGRDGRVEHIGDDRAQTFVGPVSRAEHRWRQIVHDQAGGKPAGVATFISSPTTTGLFGALTLNNERDLNTASVYDLSRRKLEKGKPIYRGLEVYRHRYRLARYEAMPGKTVDQVNLLRMLITTALRSGRPLHLFRGLPTPQKAFFCFDAMPGRLARLIGGASLRLEQLLPALDRLERAQFLLEANGLGYEVFNQYANPNTRLEAIGLAWAHLHDAQRSDRGKGAGFELARFQHEFLDLIEEHSMSEQQANLVGLGRTAAGIQRRPAAMAAANEEMLVFKLCLDTAIDLWRTGLRDHESLVMGIAGELETNLVRKNKMAARTHRNGKSLRDGCLDVARQFVDNIWQILLSGRPPSQRTRRVLGSVYRMAFLTAPRSPDNTDSDTTA